MTKQEAVRHARRCNRLVIEHKRNGNPMLARYCKGYVGRWMDVARNPAIFG